MASCLQNEFGVSSIYGSGVAVIRRWDAKSGAKRDGVGPMPAKVRIDRKEGRKEGRKTRVIEILEIHSFLRSNC